MNSESPLVNGESAKANNPTPLVPFQWRKVANTEPESPDKTLYHNRQGSTNFEVLLIGLVSLGLLGLGSLAIAFASYHLLQAVEPSMYQVSTPRSWDF